MNDKQKISAVLSVILTAVVALLAVFGYHVAIVQPKITALEAGQAAVTVPAPASAIEPSMPACPCATAETLMK